MVHQSTRLRRTLAERFATGYHDLPGVRAVLLAGSVARGCADRWSDIELMVFWDGPPPEPLRRQAAQAGGVVQTLYGYDADNDEWADDVLVSGIEVQVSHRTTAGTEAWLADVTAGFDPDLVKQDLIALIRYGVALSGGELVGQWRRRTDGYPGPLRLAMVREHLDFGSAWQRAKLLARGELLPLYSDLVGVLRRIVLVLLGLNGVWFPHLGFKWLGALDLPLAPPDLVARIDAVLTGEPGAAVRDLDALAGETLELVAEHLPEAGAAEVLAALRRRRPVR
jgi:hypothetical protein